MPCDEEPSSTSYTIPIGSLISRDSYQTVIVAGQTELFQYLANEGSELFITDGCLSILMLVSVYRVRHLVPDQRYGSISSR